MGKLHWATWLVIIVGVSLCVGSLVVSLALGDARYRSVYALLWIASVPLGCLLGTLSTPYDQAEEKTFGTAATALSGFLSGFVVSKLDRLFEGLDKDALLSATFLVALLSCVAVTLSTALVTATIRKYELDDDDEEEEEAHLPAGVSPE